jgi:hypothetical protein
MKTNRPPPKNEIFLGYATHPVIGKVVPGRKPAKKFPYNTRLDSGRGTMQSCCPCFKRPSQGACSAHNSEMYVRLMAAEAALKEADARLGAVELAYHGMSSAGLPVEFVDALTKLMLLRRVPDAELKPKAVT